MSYFATDLIDRAVTSYFRRMKRLGSVFIDQPARARCVQRGRTVIIANNGTVLGKCRVTGVHGAERFLWVDLTPREREALSATI